MNTVAVTTIHAGRIVCPAGGLNGPGSVTIQGDRIVSVNPVMPSGSRQIGSATDESVLCFPDCILFPGLTDLHAHPSCETSVFGVDPDQHLLPNGVTTVQSQGDAGALNVEQFIEETVRCSQTRVLLSINLSRIGESRTGGCLADLDDADTDQCIAAADIHRDIVRSIAVNASHHSCGESNPREVLRRGLLVAERTGLPLLYGMRRPSDWPLEDQLSLLRPGDVVTYCYRREPHCIVVNRRVLPCVRAARERGILFDVGHGMASFSFEVAEAAIADGFPPDTISSDLQRRHVGASPEHHLPLVMSKIVAAGMPESSAFAAVTAIPAAILGLSQETGILTPGACADLTLLRQNPPGTLVDVHGVRRQGTSWSPWLAVRAGQIHFSRFRAECTDRPQSSGMQQ